LIFYRKSENIKLFILAFNFAELNSIVDFYHVDSWGMNPCLPGVYNGVVPVGKTEHGTNYLLGLVTIIISIFKYI
jgi:hypothetical protein